MRWYRVWKRYRSGVTSISGSNNVEILILLAVSVHYSPILYNVRAYSSALLASLSCDACNNSLPAAQNPESWSCATE